MEIGESFFLSQPHQIDKLSIQKAEVFVKTQTEDSILFDKIKPKQRDSVSATTRRFTRSMATIVIPANHSRTK